MKYILGHKLKHHMEKTIAVIVALLVFLSLFLCGCTNQNQDSHVTEETEAECFEKTDSIEENMASQEIDSAEKAESSPKLDSTDGDEYAEGMNREEPEISGNIAPADEVQVTVETNQDKPDPDAIWKAPTEVKGIYITGPMAGNSQMENLIQLVEETQLNTMVIDVKSDDGIVTYCMNHPKVQAMDAAKGYVKDMPALVNELHEKGIYVIGRIACFKDPIMAANNPEMALCKPDGTPVADGNGIAWVNPYHVGVWDYLCSLAEQAHRDGFDEIQFDYVRFPIGNDANAADYGVDLTQRPKTEGISDFLHYAKVRLHGEGILFGADLFGTVIGSEKDRNSTGQDYAKIASLCDNICPMIYPSHYANRSFGLEVPDAKPYETIAGALKKSAEVLGDALSAQNKETKSQEQPQIQSEEQSEKDSDGQTGKNELRTLNHAAIRPWLQCFTASWVPGHIKYGSREIAVQIQAVEDAGIHEYILWNAANHYGSVKEAIDYLGS